MKPISCAPPEWSRFDDYAQLGAAAQEAHDLEPLAFLAGPFQRFIELCSTSQHAKVRARAMEYAYKSLGHYLEAHAVHNEEATLFYEQARSLLVAWLHEHVVADSEYMLEVFDGISTHHYRGMRAMI